MLNNHIQKYTKLVQNKINANWSHEQILNYYNKHTNIIQHILNNINDKYKIIISLEEDYDDNSKLTLNTSQNIVKNYYLENGIKTGIICNATGTGKTKCIFLTIGFDQQNDIIFIFCYYKNILRQMFYDNDNKLNYKNFRELKYSNIFNLWSYDIYDLSEDSPNRTSILENIETIKNINRKKIFLINPQFIISRNSKKYELLPKPNLIIHDECHSISGNYVYKFLEYYKNLNCKIVGLSATPIRNIKNQKNYDKIKSIYSLNNQINIISNYEVIKAIVNKDILNIEIFWYEVIERNQQSIDNCIETIKNILPYLPNKKLLIWCRTIEHAKTMYSQLQDKIDLPIFIDHSQSSSLEDYNKFSKLVSGILVCANKHREGSDIRYLDCVVFADMVKNKNELTFIQCIGRVQRKSNIEDENKKTVGYIIDSYDVSLNVDTKANEIIKKLISYYYDFFSITTNLNNDDHNILNMYKQIIDSYTFEKNENENIIIVKLNDDLKIIIHCNLDNIDFTNVHKNFRSVITNHIAIQNNLSEQRKLQFEYNTAKYHNSYHHIKSKLEYIKIIEKLDLIPTPEIKFESIWIDWYDYLNIDKTKYKMSFNEWLQICSNNNIQTYEQYIDKFSSDDNMPLMPQELYRFSNFNKLFTAKNEMEELLI